MTNEDLVCKYQESKEPQLLEELLKKNQKLVLWVANNYKRKFGDLYDIEDLQQLAMIGMWTAATKWQPDRGMKFTTYAIWHMKNKIIRNYAEVKSIQNTLSLDKPLDENSDLTLADTIKDESVPFWEQSEEIQFRRAFVKLVFEIVDPESGNLLRRYYFQNEKLDKAEYGKITNYRFLNSIYRNGRFAKFRREWELDRRTRFIKTTRYSHAKTSSSSFNFSIVEQAVLERLKMLKELQAK